MNTITDIYRMRRAATLASCAPPTPLCTTCGMLECVCRPRFFAGQVLNADDLNRLDAYIRAKNRLHNRQLHGWGVVNGLEVTCNPCGAGVTVSCGYALSPCGEDIVVCDPVTVDVCELISCCKNAELQSVPCDPPNPYPPGRTQGPCDAAEEDWVLAIRYSEQPARGIKPLYAKDCGGGTGGCGCGGGCGGGGGCNCKGGTAGSATAPGGCGCGGPNPTVTATKPRGAPVQCEPTVICEGYCFEVYRLPPQVAARVEGNVAQSILDSPLLTRLECCVQDLTTKAPQPPPQPDMHAWYLWALRFKDFLLRHFQTKPSYNCELLQRLQTLAIPDPQQANNIPAFNQAVEVLIIVFADAWLACICSALLPPCPLPTADLRVPLAVLHVGSNPCRVMRVCNWSTHRKFATTFPALQYWLSVLPYMRTIRQLMEKMCCFDLAGLLPQQPRVNANAGGAAAAPESAAGATTSAAATGGSTLRERMLLRLNPTLDDPAPARDTATLFSQSLFGEQKTLTPQQIVSALIGSTDPQGTADRQLSALETANLPQFVLLHELMSPIAEAVLAPTIAQFLGSAALGGAQPQPGAQPAATPDELAEMRNELSALRASVQAQAAEIERLKTSPPRRNR